MTECTIRELWLRKLKVGDPVVVRYMKGVTFVSRVMRRTKTLIFTEGRSVSEEYLTFRVKFGDCPYYHEDGTAHLQIPPLEEPDGAE